MTPPKGKPTRAEDLVDLGPETGRRPPDIPTLSKKEKKEKKGGAAVLGSGGGSSGGGFLSRLFGGLAEDGGGAAAIERGGVATVGRSAALGGARLGFGPMLVNFLASNFAAVMLTGLVTGGAVYALYSLGMSATAEKGAKASVFPADTQPKAEAAPPASVDASGLSYFQSANEGKAFQGPNAPKDTGAGAPTQDAPAAPEPKKDDKGADQQPAGNAPNLADAFMKGFEKPKMIAARGLPENLGGGNGLAGGVGMAGGMMKRFDKPVDTMKKPVAPLESMHRQVAAHLVARRMSAVGHPKGGAMEQLKFSNGMSRQALGATDSEGAAFTAAQAFDKAPAIQGGQGISSQGLSDGGSGVGSTANPDGGPLSTSNPPTQAPSTGQGQNQTPYNQALMMAMALLMTASTIITIIGILAIIKKMPIIGLLAEMWQKILYGIAIAMAGAAAAIGAMVASQYGQKDQGLMVTIGGSITAASATASLMMEQPESAWLAVIGGIAGIGASIGSLLLPMMQGNSLNGGSSSGTGSKTSGK